MKTFKNFTEQEVHNDLVAAWNEAEELNTSLLTLSDEEIKECRQALIERSEWICHWLGKYVSENDIIESL